MQRNLTLLFLVFFCSAFVRGNDTLATLGAGGLVPVKSTEIVMQAEDLSISTHKITIRYVFRNATNKDIDATVAFPLPDLDGGQVYNTPMNLPNEKALNFVQFAVAANGKPVQTRVETRAFVKDKDITSRLEAAGVPVNVFIEPLNAALRRIPQSTVKQLEREELIVRDEPQWFAMWTMRIKYYWTQRFPANSTVELVQTYRPVVGGSYVVAGYDGKETVERYCGTKETVRRIKNVREQRHAHEGDILMFEHQIDYILTTANNWKGPIGRFHLSVATDSPEDILVTCTSGLRRVTATRFELVKNSFRPDTDLKLLILQPNHGK